MARQTRGTKNRYRHPSGESTRSDADIKVTRDLIRASQFLKMELLDHVIIDNGNRSSLRQPGYFYS
jgi:DNA repair protein RadC